MITKMKYVATTTRDKDEILDEINIAVLVDVSDWCSKIRKMIEDNKQTPKTWMDMIENDKDKVCNMVLLAAMRNSYIYDLGDIFHRDICFPDSERKEQAVSCTTHIKAYYESSNGLRNVPSPPSIVWMRSAHSTLGLNMYTINMVEEKAHRREWSPSYIEMSNIEEVKPLGTKDGVAIVRNYAATYLAKSIYSQMLKRIMAEIKSFSNMINTDEGLIYVMRAIDTVGGVLLE